MIIEADIKPKAVFRLADGTDFVIEEIETHPKFGTLVKSKKTRGSSTVYRDEITDFVSFLNEEGASQLFAAGGGITPEGTKRAKGKGMKQTFKDLDATVQITLIDKDDPSYTHGYRYQASISFPESLGEMGNYSDNNVYKDLPTKEEVRADVIDTILNEIQEIEENGTSSAREENILAALKKIPSEKLKPKEPESDDDSIVILRNELSDITPSLEFLTGKDKKVVQEKIATLEDAIKMLEGDKKEVAKPEVLYELQKIKDFSKLTASTASQIVKFVKEGRMNPDEITIREHDTNKGLSLLVDGKDWHGRSFFDSYYDQQNDKQTIMKKPTSTSTTPKVKEKHVLYSDMAKKCDKKEVAKPSDFGEKFDRGGAPRYMGDKGDKVIIESIGKKEAIYYYLVNADNFSMIDMFFDSEGAARAYAQKKEMKVVTGFEQKKVGGGLTLSKVYRPTGHLLATAGGEDDETLYSEEEVPVCSVCHEDLRPGEVDECTYCRLHKNDKKDGGKIESGGCLGDSVKVGDVIDTTGFGHNIKKITGDRVFWENDASGEWCYKKDLILVNGRGALVPDKVWNAESNHNYWKCKTYSYYQLAQGGPVSDWEKLFAHPEKFMRYDGQFLYPPRIEYKMLPSSLDKLDNGQYIGQLKVNGSNTSVTIWPAPGALEGKGNKVVVKERHNTFFTTPPKFDFPSMHRGKGFMAFAGEFMNKSKKGPDGKPFRGFIIWDIMAFENKILIGSTIEERVALIDYLYPTTGAITVGGYEILHKTATPDVYKITDFEGDFRAVYDELIKVDFIEGFVLKRKNGVLSSMNKEANNTGFAVKIRKPTSNYKF